MSSSRGTRVSIPESVRKMIQNIRDITAAHEDEIYATLKECNMDPNETAQRILSQGTFHEVKSKRVRRKENSINKESAELRWKPGQGRGSRGGRGSYSSRHTSNDTGSRNSSVSEESAGILSLSSPQEPKKSETAIATSFASAITNGPSAIVTKGDISKLGGTAPHKHLDIVKGNPGENSLTGKTHGQLIANSNNNSTAEPNVISPGGHFSPLDPVLVPSQDSRVPGAAGTIKREVGIQRTPAEEISHFHSEGKTIAATSEDGNSMEGNISESKSIGVEKNHQSDTTLQSSSAHGGSSVARPSSNHSNRSQQVVDPAIVVPAKEWKPKSSIPPLAQGSSPTYLSDVSPAMEVNTQSRPATGDLDSKEASMKLQRKLEELNISDSQHVILPNHLHVPGAEKISLCFGSFDAISVGTGSKMVPNDSIPAPPLETCKGVEEMTDQTSSVQTALSTAEEGVYHDHPQSPEHVPENLAAGEHDVPGAGNQEYGETNQEIDLAQGSHQYPNFHHSPGYGYGLMPTMMGSQQSPFENTESQTRDVSHVPSFVVPQIDPAYYAQFHRSTGDGDGHISPFHAVAGAAARYNGSGTVLPPQTQSAQEGENSLVMSTSAPTAFVTQPAAGVMPSPIAVTQHPIPVFRQPFGIPFPHYTSNYIPYNPFLSQYLVSPFNNGAYPQQLQAGGIYSAPPGPSPKISLSQYKSATSSGNSTSIGGASSYGPYGPSASTSENSTTNEGFTAQQLKESNMYISVQQSEGSAVWLTPPGRDMPGVQATSFYNIPSRGQVAFPQPGHGPFTSVYHTPQAVSAMAGHPLLHQSQTMASANDLAGPAPNVYQQPQHAQVTWSNNNH